MKNWKVIFTLLAIAFLTSDCSKQDEASMESDFPSTFTPENLVDNLTRDLSSTSIPGQYIVVLKDVVGPPAEIAEQLSVSFNLSVGHVYEYALKGFSAKIPEQALNGIRQNPKVSYIEQDIKMFALAQSIPTGIRRIEADLNAIANIDGNDDRVDVDVAIIDSGIDIDHPDLNVVGGIRYYGGGTDFNYDDDNGHGTHCAGTVGALDNDIGVVGVAPGVRLWGVKVLSAGGFGSLSDIIKAVDWVTANASTIEVANMSLGGQGTSVAFRTAIAESVAAGVVYVVAAGNNGGDVYGDGIFGNADDYIPSSYPEVAAISAMVDSDGQPGGLGNASSYGSDDSFASFSNYSSQVVTDNPVSSPGKAIDLLLPGVSIYSTYKDGQYATYSGTSMASPHGAGLVALYIAQNGRASNARGVYAIRQALIDAGVAQTSSQGLNTFNDPDGNQENIGWAGANAPGPQAPIADAGENITVDDNDGNGSETVTLDGSNSYDPDGSIASDAYEWDTNGDGNTDLTGPSVEATFAVGTHNVTLTVTDNDGLSSSDQIIVTVNEAPAGISITGIMPDAVDAGASITVTISGMGFSNGASVSVENGSGPSPSISNIVVVDSQTITATFSAQRNGPKGSRVWDVRVTNPGGASAVRAGGFTVNR